VHGNQTRTGGPRQTLFQWELHSDFDVFYGAAERYAKILGPRDEGLPGTGRRRVGEGPARTAKHDGPSWASTSASRILWNPGASVSDVEEIVTVMSRDLSSAYSYLKIAKSIESPPAR